MKKHKKKKTCYTCGLDFDCKHCWEDTGHPKACKQWFPKPENYKYQLWGWLG